MHRYHRSLTPSGDEIANLLTTIGIDNIQRAVPLNRISRWQVGGPAQVLVEPSSAAQVSRLVSVLRRNGVPYVVVGDMSNILFDDAGYNGVLIRIGRKMARMAIGDDGMVRAQGGAWVPGYVRNVINAGLSGCVHAIGIPGTVGGLVVMNGGSQRKGIGDHLESATFVSAVDGAIQTVSRAACGFAYRTSAFQYDGAIVVEATFRYAPGDVSQMRREGLAILTERNQKFPRKDPNCGSVFLSDPKLYATVGPPGAAFEQVGLKGMQVGGALISPLHANFIVNTGGARAIDILSLIRTMRDRVHEHTGVLLDCEVRHLTPEGVFRMAHLSAAELPR